MGMGEPVVQTDSSTYFAEVVHTPTGIKITANPAFYLQDDSFTKTEADRDEAFQAFIDTLDASPDFTVSGTSKDIGGYVEFTVSE